MDFKNIHIGKLIEKKCGEKDFTSQKICEELKLDEEALKNVFSSQSVDSDTLLKFSKLLDYDFFRVYSHHILLYTAAHHKRSTRTEIPKNPEYKKNIYTKEIISFILESIESGDKTKQQVIDDYRIPKTTLYKWLSKYYLDKEDNDLQ